MRIDQIAILYRPSISKPCTSCTYISGSHCDMWDAETRPGMGFALWLKNRQKGVDGE